MPLRRFFHAAHEHAEVVNALHRYDVGRRLIVDQSATSFLGMSAKTTMAAATIEVAVDNNITPRDPGVAVSPF